MKSAVSVTEALELWREAIQEYRLEIETISVKEAKGRILAVPISALFDVPAFAKSSYDGYAISYEEGRRSYVVQGIIGAGTSWDKILSQGEAVRIMTGGMIPTGADTVVMQEQVVLEESGAIKIQGKVERGQHIILRGEECSEGDTIYETGRRITVEMQAVMVGLGYVEVQVYRPVQALLVTSGKEVVEVGACLGSACIYNSNKYMLKGLLEEIGVLVESLHISDDPETYTKELSRLREASRGKDVIISTGGVSVGLYDYFPRMYKELGTTTLYTRLLMRPGAASFGGVRKEQLIIGLSGNPVAAYNAFVLIASPILQEMQGEKATELPCITCRMGTAHNKKNPVERYIQGQIVWKAGEAIFYSNEVATSSALLSMGEVQALAVLPQGSDPVVVGDKVDVYLLP